MRRLRMPVLAAALVAIPCFADAVKLPEVTYRTNDAGNVLFSHALHLRRDVVGTNCKVCHAQRSKKIRATMAQMEKGRSCGACHDGSRAFGLQSCSGCHDVPAVRLTHRATGKVIFDHDAHAEASPCDSCHPKLYKTGRNKPVGMAQMEKGKSCGACHNGTKSFPVSKCASCHPTREVKFPVKGIDPGHFSHASHLKMYGCAECHPRLYSTAVRGRKVSMEEMEKGKSCGACHDGKTAFTVKGSCGTCH